MLKLGIPVSLCAVLVVWTFALSAQPEGQLTRGKYLVEEVARCIECHTPRRADGEIDRSQLLQGAPIWFQPVQSMPDWAYRAPALAGLASFSERQVISVLTTGVASDGTPVRRPMHRYHLNRDDAAAIVIYLKSLKPPIR